MDVENHGVHIAYMPRRTVRPIPKTRRLPTFIRQWRNSKNLSLAKVAERVGCSHATLSRIENGKQDYNQTLLELLAQEFGTDPASLLMRDPSDPEGMWSVMDQAKPAQRRAIVEIAKTILRNTGS